MNKEELKKNLNNVKGINPKVTDITWDLKVIVDGYEFTITEYGSVISVGKNQQENLPENTENTDAGTEH